MSRFIDTYREMYGQPFVITYEPFVVEDTGEIIGYDIVFQPEMNRYGVSMFVTAMFIDNERFEPEEEGFVELSVDRVWELTGYRGDTRNVVEFTADVKESFGIMSFDLSVDDIEDLYAEIEEGVW